MPRDEHATLAQRLRDAAERCIVSLGTGLLRGDGGKQYIDSLSNDRQRCAEYFGQLRVLLLQIIAWVIGERRGAVPRGQSAAVTAYGESYSLARLCESGGNDDIAEHGPRWRRLQRVLIGLWRTDEGIGVTQWGSELFDPVHTSGIAGLCLRCADTQALLASISSELVESCSGDSGADIQLLGYVHEWLMERRMVVDVSNRRVLLEACAGHERRATGSYFTPAPLVDHLLDVCFEPLLDARSKADNPEASIDELLQLRIVDPACGTGVFLVAAAQRIARRIDALRGSVSPRRAERQSRALRDVICRCVYGVDLGPTTVSLCRLGLWFTSGEPYEAIPELREHVRCGNSAFGVWPGFESTGVLDAVFEPSEGDDVEQSRSLKSRNRAERRREGAIPDSSRAEQSTPHDTEQIHFLADLWCATFVWPKRAGTDMPTQIDFELARQAPEAAHSRWGHAVQSLVDQYRFFHWWLEFADIFGGPGVPAQKALPACTGFDLVIGNPPWVAYAGRSTQPLHAGHKRFYCANYRAFGGFPTTHGIFVELATRLVRAHGRIGLIIPASVADLAGYAPTRHAHDERCKQICPLPDFGEGRFAGVTQPCIALVSERLEASDERASSDGSPWVLDRSDLDPLGLDLLARLTRSSPFPESLFGERGFQSTPPLRSFIRRQDRPNSEFNVALREGTDVREFHLGKVRHYADASLFGRGLRPLGEFEKVALVVRQTARYPIAARSDGQAFRNSLLAVLHDQAWPWSVMLCLLNSALFRWCHYYRFRDGRQPILPQLKVGHLRALPAPTQRSTADLILLEKMGSELSERNQGVDERERGLIDQCVNRLYGLADAEQRMVTCWHAQRPR